VQKFDDEATHIGREVNIITTRPKLATKQSTIPIKVGIIPLAKLAISAPVTLPPPLAVVVTTTVSSSGMRRLYALRLALERAGVGRLEVMG